MDLSTESQHLLPSLIRYATAYGAVSPLIPLVQDDSR